MKSTALLRRRILNRDARVGVIGQGYVGLSLSCASAEAGFGVVGFDIDAQRVGDLRMGRLSVSGVPETLFRQGLDSGRVTFTNDSNALRNCDLILICVPTPLRDHTPDLSYIERSCRQVAEVMRAGSVVVLESTTYPGTTEQVVMPLLEESGLTAGKEFLLAYSPERIDPGNEEYTLKNTPKIVGGLTPEATGVASLFYGQIVEKVVVVSSCRAAELAKLLENTFRHVNVALVNEMAMLCHDTGSDVWEVIGAAETKPFGFMPFYPGPGVGGHCIPLDPGYLSWQVRRDAGRQFRILEEAQDINVQMPTYVANRIGETLNDHGRAVRGAEILILGVAYKADLGDVRESPALRVIQQLVRRGARVSYHDPHVPVVNIHDELMTSVRLGERTVASADCVVILTPHSAYDLNWLATHARVVFDARNAFGQDRRANVVRL